MSKGQIFTADQISSFYGPAISKRDLIRHYTLQASDLVHIRCCRADHNRLGFAVMLCYLRYPGRPLLEGEKPPRDTVEFIADQIDVLPQEMEQHHEQNRRRHSALLQDLLNLRPYGTVTAKDLQQWLVPHAIERDQLGHLATMIMQECRERRITLPPMGSLQRLCIRTRAVARREAHSRLIAGLTADQKHYLDRLTTVREGTTQTWLAWCRQFPESSKPVAQLLKSIELLRSLNRSGRTGLPQDAPTGFITRRWARYVRTDGILNRRHYELCVLSELRERLRAGDVWVVGSQAYKSFEERLISHEDLKTLTKADGLQIKVPSDFDAFLKNRQALLNMRLGQVEAKAKGGDLVDVSMNKGSLKISPIEKTTNPQTDALIGRLYCMLPRFKITDLLGPQPDVHVFSAYATNLNVSCPLANVTKLMSLRPNSAPQP